MNVDIFQCNFYFENIRLNVISMLKQNPFTSGKFAFCPFCINLMKESCFYYHSVKVTSYLCLS